MVLIADQNEFLKILNRNVIKIQIIINRLKNALQQKRET